MGNRYLWAERKEVDQMLPCGIRVKVFSNNSGEGF